MTSNAAGLTLGMTAIVCCVHDREKRQIVELEFDITETKVHLCSCCENLFLEVSDEPMFCPTCRRPPKHLLGGPLPEPHGVA